MQERKTVSMSGQEGKSIPIAADEDAAAYTAQVIAPILVEGEAVGAVALLSKENGAGMGDAEIKVAQTAAGFIGRQMEQ